MPHHRIRFTKRIYDDTGHLHQTTQGVVEIHHARDRDRAVKAAQHRFARQHRINRWDIHADGYEVHELEAAKRAGDVHT